MSSVYMKEMLKRFAERYEYDFPVIKKDESDNIIEIGGTFEDSKIYDYFNISKDTSTISWRVSESSVIVMVDTYDSEYNWKMYKASYGFDKHVSSDRFQQVVIDTVTKGLREYCNYKKV